MTHSDLDFLAQLHERGGFGNRLRQQLLYRLTMALHTGELLQLAREAVGAREESAKLRRRGRDRPSFVEVSSGLKKRLEQHAKAKGLPGWAAAARAILSNETRQS